MLFNVYQSIIYIMYISRFDYAKISYKVSRFWVNVLQTESSLQQGRTLRSLAARENESLMEIFMRIRCMKQCQ